MTANDGMSLASATAWRARWPGGPGPRVSRDHVYLWNRYHATPAPGPNRFEPRNDVVLQVPAQEQHVVGPRLFDQFRRSDRDVTAGQIPSMLLGVGVDGVIDQFPGDPAVVEQRVALPMRAVARDVLAIPFGVDQEIQQLVLRCAHALGEHGVVVQRPDTG